MLLTVESPEIAAFKAACKRNKVWGVFSPMERNDDPRLPPFNTAIIVNSEGELALHYPKRELPHVGFAIWRTVNMFFPGTRTFVFATDGNTIWTA